MLTRIHCFKLWSSVWWKKISNLHWICMQIFLILEVLTDRRGPTQARIARGWVEWIQHWLMISQQQWNYNCHYLTPGSIFTTLQKLALRQCAPGKHQPSKPTLGIHGFPFMFRSRRRFRSIPRHVRETWPQKGHKLEHEPRCLMNSISHAMPGVTRLNQPREWSNAAPRSAASPCFPTHQDDSRGLWLMLSTFDDGTLLRAGCSELIVAAPPQRSPLTLKGKRSRRDGVRECQELQPLTECTGRGPHRHGKSDLMWCDLITVRAKLGSRLRNTAWRNDVHMWKVVLL